MNAFNDIVPSCEWGFFCTGLNLVHFLGEEFVLIVTSHFYQNSRLQFAYFQRVVLGNVLFGICEPIISLHIDYILRVIWGIEKCDGKTVEMRWERGAAFGPFIIHECIQYDTYISNSLRKVFWGIEKCDGKTVGML